MATLGLGVAGAAVGFAIGGPFGAALLGAQLGFLAGTIIGSLLFAPEFEIEGNRLDDLSVLTSTYGKTIPLIYGTRRIAGNVIWATDLVEHVQQDTEGGKGGPKTTTRTYTYSTSFAIGLCEGPVQCINKIWADGKLLVNLSGDTEPLATDALGLNLDPRDVWVDFHQAGEGDPTQRQITLSGLRIYTGTSNQDPDPAIQAEEGLTDTPAYRGLCYLVFDDLALTDFGNRIPQITASVSHPSCIEAFPSESSVGYDTDAALFQFSADFKTAVTLDNVGADEFITHWDLVNHVIIKQIPFTDTITGDDWNINTAYIDVTKRWMILAANTQGLSGNSTIGLFNIDTGQRVATSEVNEWQGPVGHDNAGLKCNDWVYIWGKVSGGNWIAINVSTLPPLTLEDPDVIPALSISKSFEDITIADLDNGMVAPSVLSAGPHFCDKFDQYWAYWPNGGNMYITRFAAGWPVEQKEFVGISFGGDGPVYEPVEHAIVGYNSSNSRWEKYSIDTLALLGTIAIPSSPSNGDLWTLNRTQPFAGQIIFDGSPAGRIDILNMVDVDSGFDMGDWQAFGSGGNIQYSPIDHVAITTNSNDSNQYFNYLDRGDAGTEPLSDVITDITIRTGMSSSDIDVTDITSDTVHGWAIDRQGPAKNAIRQCMQPYFFDVVETDYLIDFIKRGGGSIRTIPEDDLGATTAGKNPTEHVIETRPQEFENLPAVISMSYPDKDNDDLTNTQVWRRASEAIVTKQRLDIDLPFVFPDATAATILIRLGTQFWSERSSYQTVLTWGHVDLNPADVITLTWEGTTAEMFITDLAFGSDGSVLIQGKSQDTAIFSITGTSQSQLGVPPNVIESRGPVLGFAADMNSFRPDEINLHGYYVVAGPTSSTSNFQGMELFASSNQSDWTSISAVTSAEVGNLGNTTNTLAAPSLGHTIIDRINTVNLNLTSGSLASSTETGVLDGETNAIAIEASQGGGWEILQFIDATLESDGTYTISNLLRGRRGTENYMAGHLTGDRFFVPSTTTVKQTQYDQSLNGTIRYHSAVPFNSLISQGQITQLTPVGRRLRTWAPGVHEAYTQSDGDIALTWRRRSRLPREGSVGGDFSLKGIDAPEADYEVDFLAADGTTVVRTVTLTASAGGSVITLPGVGLAQWTGDVTCIYTAADIATDSYTGTLANCYQINELLEYNSGRGEVRQVTIDEDS